MPAAFAHTLFGKNILESLDDSIQSLIYKHIDYYYIGLFGPDILFYNEPLKKNDVNQYGYHLHQLDAYDFFKNAKNILHQTHEKEKTLVYILGFINHFILDSECHGYIGQVEKETHLSHASIESDFERALLQSKGFKASSTKLLKHIHYTKDMSEIIAPIFQLTPKDIHESIKGMFFFLELLRCPSKIKRQVLKHGMKAFHVYDSMYGLIIHDEANPQAITSTNHLISLFHNAKAIAITQINEFYQHINDDYLSNRFHRNFE